MAVLLPAILQFSIITVIIGCGGCGRSSRSSSSISISISISSSSPIDLFLGGT
jgi:hypothetical protein